MKAWMKILMWLGLGGGIGFFAGYRIGSNSSENRLREERDESWNKGYDQGYEDCDVFVRKQLNKNLEDHFNSIEEAKRAMDIYSGGIKDDEEDVEMPEDPPVIGDEEYIEVPELHPQHMIPRVISEEEYYENPNRYDQESLIYYEADGVLFNKDTRKAIKNKDEIDQIIGVGSIFSFYGKDGENLDAIFVENSTMGVIFRIDRVDDAYDDPVSGANAPDYEEDDTE